MKKSHILFLFLILCLAACRSTPPAPWQPPTKEELAKAEDLADSLSLLFPDLFTPLPTPPPVGSWQQAHPDESPQPFKFYSRNNAAFSEEKKYIYTQQLGKFAARDSVLLLQCEAALSSAFNREVLRLEVDTIPPPLVAQRRNKHEGQRQWRSSYLLHNKLLKKRPDSTFAYLGFTGIDLYPSDKWNYVFGQASIRQRTGVWSFYRFHRASPEQADSLAYFRALKTALHETGHIIGIRHCQAWNCVMSGSNNLRDLDARPVHFCPQCIAKLCRATGQQPEYHFERMALFWVLQPYQESRSHYLEQLRRWRVTQR